MQFRFNGFSCKLLVQYLRFHVSYATNTFFTGTFFTSTWCKWWKLTSIQISNSKLELYQKNKKTNIGLRPRSVLLLKVLGSILSATKFGGLISFLKKNKKTNKLKTENNIVMMNFKWRKEQKLKEKKKGRTLEGGKNKREKRYSRMLL
jgi:hypothetical protein